MTPCEHERFRSDCESCQAEMDASYREAMVGYRGERIYQQAMKLAREDLDMDDATELELSHAILLRLK